MYRAACFRRQLLGRVLPEVAALPPAFGSLRCKAAVVLVVFAGLALLIATMDPLASCRGCVELAMGIGPWGHPSFKQPEAIEHGRALRCWATRRADRWHFASVSLSQCLIPVSVSVVVSDLPSWKGCRGSFACVLFVGSGES